MLVAVGSTTVVGTTGLMTIEGMAAILIDGEANVAYVLDSDPIVAVPSGLSWLSVTGAESVGSAGTRVRVRVRTSYSSMAEIVTGEADMVPLGLMLDSCQSAIGVCDASNASGRAGFVDGTSAEAGTAGLADTLSACCIETELWCSCLRSVFHVSTRARAWTASKRQATHRCHRGEEEAV